MTKHQPLLIIIDFDLTLTTQHTHNLIHHAIRSQQIAADDHEAAWQLLKAIPPTGSIQKWQQIFAAIKEKQHLVAIASFSEFPTLIQRYLREIIGVSDIMVESWLPQSIINANKNQHIEYIMQRYNFSGPAENIILIDDDTNNRAAAKKLGYKTISVTPGDLSGKHTDEILGCL